MLEINAKNISAASKRIRSGVATESDRLEFEMHAVELRLDRDRTEMRIAADAAELWC